LRNRADASERASIIFFQLLRLEETLFPPNLFFDQITATPCFSPSDVLLCDCAFAGSLSVDGLDSTLLG